MPGLLDRIRRLISPEQAERGAEDDVIERAPEGVRGRLREVIQRRRQAHEAEKRRHASGSEIRRRQGIEDASQEA